MQILSHYSNWQFSWREKHWTLVPASNDTSRVRKKNGGPLAHDSLEEAEINDVAQ